MRIDTRFSQLFELFDGPPSPETAHSRQVAELDRLSGYCDKLREQDRKMKQRSKGMFTLMGLILLALGVAAFLPAMPGMENLFPASSEGFVTGFGLVMLAVAAFFTMNTLKFNPLREIRKKLDSLYAGLLRSRTRNPVDVKSLARMSRRPEPVVAGVASRISARTGLPVGLVRLFFVIGTFFTGGMALLAYFVLALIFTSGSSNPASPRRF